MLDVAFDELIELGKNLKTPKKTIKTRYEYLHIFDNELAISKTPELNNLVEDYGKSVNNVFKTLMVFFVSIPTFTVLAIILYNKNLIGPSLFIGSGAILFLSVAFNTLLFTSGTSLIKKEDIYKISIKRTLSLHQYVLIISHIESGRLKERGLLLEKKLIDATIDCLTSVKLIDKNNIKLRSNMVIFERIAFILVFSCIFLLNTIFKKVDISMYCFSAIYILICLVLIVKMILRINISIGTKAKNEPI